VKTADKPAQELAVYRRRDMLFCVLLEDGQPAEVVLAAPGQTFFRQNLYLGKVRQVTPALNGAFIDIGDSHDALLPLNEAPPGIKAGQTLCVQLRKLTAPGKGHRVSTRFELPGLYAVWLLDGHHRRRSKLREFEPDERERLYRQDLERLERFWQTLEQDMAGGPVPRLLYPLGEPCYIALTSWVGPNLARIRVAEPDLYEQVRALLAAQLPAALPLLHFQPESGGYGLADILGLADLEEHLTRRKVWLDKGGFIVIDTTEALTVIDVNSGKDTGGRSGQDLRLRTNLQAAAAVAAELRLRNTAGMIVIDFLRLASDDDNNQVDAALRRHLGRDRARCKCLGFTAMGLYELVRTAR